jgi:predicted site-specific integrase-resolvase
MSLKDAAAWAGVSGRTIKRWIAAGLPMYQERPRSKILIRPEDIELFLTKRQVPGPDLNAIVSQVITEMEGKAKS